MEWGNEWFIEITCGMEFGLGLIRNEWNLILGWDLELKLNVELHLILR